MARIKQILAVNPKDILGIKKVNTFLFPPVAFMHGVHAMMDGARKYGPYNWRGKKVIASIYIAAAMRHIMAWQEGEEFADDSGVHHGGHALACIAIILDAQATGNLIDDRAVGGKLSEVIKELNKKIQEKFDEIQRHGATPKLPAARPRVVRRRRSVGK